MADHRPKNQAESIDITGSVATSRLLLRHFRGGRNPVLARVRELSWLPAGVYPETHRRAGM